MRLRALFIAATAATALIVVAAGVVIAGPSASQRPANKALFAVLTGDKEVSAEGDRGAGDRNGRGAFNATFDGNELCYGISVKNIQDPVDAHIHRGSRNVAGPVVVPLEFPASGDPGASSACTDVARRLARAIRRNPNRFYVNVHTADFPGGAVRGQLFGRQR